MIDINNIKLNTSVLELGLSAKLLNRLKLSHVENFQQMMELDTSSWENVVAAKVISAMRNAQSRFEPQYQKLIQQQKAVEVKQSACPTPEVSSDPQLDGQAYSQMTNTSFAVPATYDQRRFFVANNILNAYVLSGRLQDEEGPLPVVMREIVKVADAFMDAFDGKPYVEEEDEEEEEVIIPIPTVVTPEASQKQEPKQKAPQQSQSDSPKENKNKKKDKVKGQKQDNQKQNSTKLDSQKQDSQNEDIFNETIEKVEDPDTTPVIVIDVDQDPEGTYQMGSQEVIEVPQEALDIPEQEETPVETIAIEEAPEQSKQPQHLLQPQEESSNYDTQHPDAERGQRIRIAKYLGRGKRGSKYFQPGDTLTVKRMRKGDDGVIIVSATINGKNVCFDSKHYTWDLDQA